MSVTLALTLNLALPKPGAFYPRLTLLALTLSLSNPSAYTDPGANSKPVSNPSAYSDPGVNPKPVYNPSSYSDPAVTLSLR